MHLQEEIRGEVAVIQFKGDLIDETDTVQLQEKITSLKVDGIGKIVFDLGHVQRINSKGLSALITAFRNVRDAGGDIRFAQIDKRIQDIFIKTRLTQVFSTYETVGRAMASYNR